MAGSDHRLWTVVELSEFLQVPVKTLYEWRSRGYGPRGRRIGKYVRYTEADVLAWVDSLGDNVA
jgi:predicted DNA-binding transcriptional regulator AlpA